MEKRPFREIRDKLLLLAAATAVVCFVVLLFFRMDVFASGARLIFGLLTPFLCGIAIAYVLRPVCCLIEKWLKHLIKNHNGAVRMISILLTLVLMFAVLFLLVIAVLPGLVSSITSLVKSLPAALENFIDWLQTMDKGGISHEIVTQLEMAINTVGDNVEEFLETTVLPNMESLVTEVTSSFMDIVNLLKNFGLGCIVAAYLLGGWEKYMAQAKLLVYGMFPQKAADWIRDEVHFTDKMFSGFILGKILDSTIIGIICFVFTSVTVMPYALLVSVVVGVTNIIPFFGPYIGAIPSALLILSVSPGKCVVFVIFIILLQQLDGNVIGPTILGDRLGIGGIWILFSILIFGSLWGILGMLIGVPVFAVLYDLVRRLILYGLRSRKQEALLTEYQKEFAGEPAAPKKIKKRKDRKKNAAE